MDELGGKIVAGIIVAILVFTLQILGVNKLIIGIFGGVSNPVIDKVLSNNSKNEGLFWESTDKCGTKKCYQIYLNKYPQGFFSSIAKEKINTNINIKPVEKYIEQYIDNNDGTITDAKAGLMWKKCSEGVTGKSCDNFRNHKFFKDISDAMEYAKLSFSGYNDWRVPEIYELKTLIYCRNRVEVDMDNYCKSSKFAIEYTIFPNTLTWNMNGGHGVGYLSSNTETVISFLSGLEQPIDFFKARKNGLTGRVEKFLSLRLVRSI